MTFPHTPPNYGPDDDCDLDEDFVPQLPDELNRLNARIDAACDAIDAALAHLRPEGQQ